MGPEDDLSDPQMDLDLDLDGDGLSTAEEIELGSDPENPDTDGDGWTDGEEVAGNTDPTDAADHPYTGGWLIDACRHDIQATGNELGDIAEDFGLHDQFGDEVHLHDFCGKEVVLITAALWHGPSLEAATRAQSLYETYEEQGLLPIALVAENQAGEPPKRSEREAFAAELGLTYPVVLDTSYEVSTRFIEPEAPSLAGFHVIAPGARVVVTNAATIDAAMVESYLP